MQCGEVKQKLVECPIQSVTTLVVGIAGCWIAAQGVMLTVTASSTADSVASLGIDHLGGAYLVAGSIRNVYAHIHARREYLSRASAAPVRFQVVDTLSKIVTFQKYGALDLRRVVIRTCNNPTVLKMFFKLFIAELNEAGTEQDEE